MGDGQQIRVSGCVDTRTPRGDRTIEMTITHKSRVVYGREMLATVAWLGMLRSQILEGGET